MNKIMEKPFEYLVRRENGMKFEEEIVRNWYIARSYILERLKDVAFKPNSTEHLHFLIMKDTPRMLCLVRQIALSSHFINYDEENEIASLRNRTVITIVSQNPYIKVELEKEEYLCNLPKYCKYVEGALQTENEDSYIDIEIQIIPEASEEEKAKCDYVFTEEDLKEFCKQKALEGTDIYSIDTRKAIYTRRIYSLGTIIDDLPAEDIHNVSRYALALNAYQYHRLKEEPMPLMDENNLNNQTKVKETLSNIFCSDCFESRNLSIKLCCNGDKRRETALWKENNKSLSKSEHARWVVEKLIMGYSPFDEQQRFKDESLSYDIRKKAQYRKALKNNDRAPSHIDLCSYRDLRRINPNDMKYDSFLMLAIPMILKKVNNE